MGVIDLNRNRGVNITDKPNAGVSTGGFNDLSRSLASVERANQNLARGIAHVGETFFKIYNDRADERNRQEILEGQTALFDFSQAEKDKLSEDLRTGKYDGVGGKQAYEKACFDAQKKITEQFDKWTTENVSSDDTRNNLRENAILRGKDLFAQMAGEFIRYDNQRSWDLFQSQSQRAIADGNLDNLKTAFKAYVGMGKDANGNELPTKKSKEFADNLWADLEHNFSTAQLNKIVVQSKMFATDEGALNYLAQAKLDITSGKAGIENDEIKKKASLYVDEVFKVSSHKASAKAICDKIDEIKYQDISHLTEKDVAPFFEQQRKQILALKGIAKPKQIDEALNFLDKTQKETTEKILEAVQNRKWSSITNSLKHAIENNGDMPIDFIKEHSLSKEAIADIQTMRKASLGQTQQDAMLYRQKSNELFAEIFRLKNTDSDSLKKKSTYVQHLLIKTQGLDAKDRILALKMLNNRINNTPPPNWTTSSWKAFEKQLDKKILWNDNLDKNDSKTNNLYMSFVSELKDEIQNRGIKNELEAEKYIENHPIYKNLLGKKSAKMVEMLLNGQVPISDEETAQLKKFKEWEAMPIEQKRKKIVPWAYSQYSFFGGIPPLDFSEKYIRDADIKAYEKEMFYGKK